MTADSSRVLHHRPDCREPRENDYLGRKGDPMRGCFTCHAFSIKGPSPDAQEPATVSRYRCRTHPDVPVTWRGTGCGQCSPRQRANANEENQ